MAEVLDASGAADPPVRHEFVEAGGLRFHVATCGEGERLALCLHGFPECWISWRFQLPLLARLGYRAWAPDLRGYGESARPRRTRDYAIERLVEDVAALIDASGARETVLLGHDWGGIIAWYAAMRRVRPLARLVVMNAPHPTAAAPNLPRLEQLRRFWYALLFQLPWLPERALAAANRRGIGHALLRSSTDPSRFPEDVLAVYREMAAQPGAPKAMLDYYRDYLRGGGRRRQREIGSPVIETPTLVLWGEQDPVLPLKINKGLELYVRDLTLRALPGGSHWVQQDAPEAVNACLRAWLSGEPMPVLLGLRAR